MTVNIQSDTLNRSVTNNGINVILLLRMLYSYSCTFSAAESIFVK
jgi:hypothetical protein